MKFPIGFGRFNKYYFLILGSFLIKIFGNLIEGVVPTLNVGEPFYLFQGPTEFLKHIYVKSMIRYLGIFIGGIIFFIVSKKMQESFRSDEIQKKSIPETENPRKMELLHYDYLLDKSFDVRLNAILVMIVYFLADNCQCVLKIFEGSDLNFWMLEILFMMFFSHRFLFIKIYNHQRLAVTIIIMVCFSLQLITSIFPRGDYDCSPFGSNKELCKYIIYMDYNSVFTVINKKMGVYAIVLIIMTYIIVMMFNALVSIKQKWLMDFRFMSPYKILILIGFTGLIFSFIILMILSYIPCDKNNLYMYQYCQSLSIENGLTVYFDSIYVYLKALKDKWLPNDKGEKKSTEALIEIFLVYPLYMITNFGNSAFDILVVKYLDPMYLILINVLYNSALRSIVYFIEKQSDKSNYYIILNFILKKISYVIAILCYLIYLEIVELRFHGYDINLKNRIIDRGIKEIAAEDENLGDTISYDNIDYIPSFKSQELMDYNTKEENSMPNSGSFIGEGKDETLDF